MSEIWSPISPIDLGWILPTFLPFFLTRWWYTSLSLEFSLFSFILQNQEKKTGELAQCFFSFLFRFNWRLHSECLFFTRIIECLNSSRFGDVLKLVRLIREWGICTYTQKKKDLITISPMECTSTANKRILWGSLKISYFRFKLKSIIGWSKTKEKKVWFLPVQDIWRSRSLQNVQNCLQYSRKSHLWSKNIQTDTDIIDLTFKWPCIMINSYNKTN